MTRGLRIAAAGIVLLALASCSRIFPVRAAFLDGRLVFVSEEFERLEYPWCIDRFAIVDDSGSPVWKFDVQDVVVSAERRCAAHFPIPYGEAPQGAAIEQPAQRLQRGRLYLIQGWGSDGVEGAFTLYRAGGRLAVANVPMDAEHISLIRQRFNEREYGRRRDAGGERAEEQR